jgi:hypothetical protein
MGANKLVMKKPHKWKIEIRDERPDRPGEGQRTNSVTKIVGQSS